MPYTLKPNKLFVKDPNGDGYLPQNVVTDQTTADMVQAINTAGAAQQAALEARSQEIIQDWPDTGSELTEEVRDLKSAFDLPDFAKGLIVGSPTSGANSFRWYGPNGTSDISGRVGLMNEIPVSELVADRLPETDGSYHIFIQIPAYNQMAQPDDQYLPFTAVIEMEPGQTLSAGFRFGFATNVSINTNYTVMNLARVEAGFSGGFKSKNDTYTKSYTTTTPFSWAYLNASRADLLKVRKISFVLSPVIGNAIGGMQTDVETIQNSVGGLQTDVETIQNSVGGLQTDVETIQNNTRSLTEQLTDSVLFRGSDREYINGALTSPHVVEYRRKSIVANVIPDTATGPAGAFFNLAPSYRVDAIEGNYYPFTVFLHVKGGEQLSGNGIFIHYSTSGSSYVSNYANQISTKYIGKESGYCSVNKAFIKTYASGGTTLQYLVLQGSSDDLRKIEYVELVLNDFAAPLNKTELETQIAELDKRVEVIEGEIDTKLNDYAIISYGDSLTQGAGTSSWQYNYTNQCRLALGAKNCINYGYGGSASAAIAFTAGALSGYIPPNVRSFALKYADLTTDIAIALTQLNNKEVVVDGNTYTISQTGNTAYSLPSTYTPSDLWLPVRVKNSLNTADIYIIWVGTNDGEYKWDIIDAMISKCQHKQYVVMGLTRLGTDTTVENEQIAYRKYGSHFFNTRIQIINNAFTILGMTPTADDTTAMNSGLMPPSLLTDNVHFNDNGYIAIGKLLAKHIQSLGYSYQKAE